MIKLEGVLTEALREIVNICGDEGCPVEQAESLVRRKLGTFSYKKPRSFLKWLCKKGYLRLDQPNHVHDGEVYKPQKKAYEFLGIV
jgi:hypothetical protein